MVHDCVITDNYTIILDFPLTVRPRRFLRNGFPVEYESNHPARIGIVSRRKDADGGEIPTKWFDVDAGVVLHVANAFERENGEVVIHGLKAVPKGEKSYILDYTPSFLHQWVLDSNTDRVAEDRCLNAIEPVEFPSIEDRFVGQDSGCIYALQVTSIGGPVTEFKTPQAGVLLDGLVKFTTEKKSQGKVVDSYALDDGWHFCSEPTLVTKTSGDGHFILSIATYVPEESSRDHNYNGMVQNGSSLRSKMLILDGNDLSAGPVSIIDLPHHVNYGLHSLYLLWENMS